MDRATRPGSGSVTGRRRVDLSTVRHRLFPKTRSWFALDAPLELLSPLSVLRILAGLAWLAWPLSWLTLRGPYSSAALTLAATAAGLAAWAVLLIARRLSPIATALLILGGVGNVSLLVWSGHGHGLTLEAITFTVPLGVFVALFHRRRDLIGYIAVTTLGLWAGLTSTTSPLRAAIIASACAVPLAAACATVALLVTSSRRQRETDAETGIPNGFGFATRLSRLRRDDGHPSDAVMVATIAIRGIDDARAALGYKVGNELFRRVIEDMGQVLPSGAVIGRLDGDQLAVAHRLPAGRPAPAHGGHHTGDGVSEAQPDEVNGPVSDFARMLADTVDAGRYVIGGVEVVLRGHVGTAVASTPDADINELIRYATLGAAQALDSGQAHAWWDRSGGGVTTEDLVMLAGLRRAVQRDELWLAYQPQVVASNGFTAAVEALLRWSSPDHGEVPPGRFIPLAERTGLIDRLTEWVLPAALDAQVRWRRAGIDLPVSVNVSAVTLARSDFSGWILGELRTRGLPTRCLTVEVTETAAANQAQAVEVLGPLHQAGVQVSIDDFGTGFTSLGVLPTLPIDELKVDQTFVRRSPNSPADEAIVRTVADLAHRLGLHVVAEGVEDEALADRMTELGIDLLQGYHFARPLAERDLLAALAEGGSLALAEPGRPDGSSLRRGSLRAPLP